MKRLWAAAAAIAALLSASPPIGAHEVDHAVEAGEALVVRLEYASGGPFAYESYEVYRPGESTPFQVGRTDALGRISFLPDADGDWRVRAFSEDGHGTDFKIPATAASPSAAQQPGSSARASRVTLGIGIILGSFGALALLRARRR